MSKQPFEYWAITVVPPKIQEDSVHLKMSNGAPVFCWDFNFYDRLNEMAYKKNPTDGVGGPSFKARSIHLRIVSKSKESAGKISISSQ